jgi:hypothetical protein
MLQESRSSFCSFLFSCVLLLCLAGGFALVNITAVFFYKNKVHVRVLLKKKCVGRSELDQPSTKITTMEGK